MKKTKLMGLLAVAALMTGVVGCGDDTPEIAILVPSADHGWTAAVMQNAQAYAKELNKEYEGTYNFTVRTSAGDNEQIGYVNDILAAKDAYAGVVMLPQSNGVESAVTKLANDTLPFVMFDRIIENEATAASDSWVAGVKGDNEGIGKETAKKFQALGLTTNDHILIIPGDNSSVPESRNKGFKDHLLANGWTEALWDTNVVMTDYTGWSRQTGGQLFQDWLTGSTFADGERWFIFTHDSEISMGIVERLASASIEADDKQSFKDHVEVLASSSGLEEMYQVIRGDHPRSGEYDAVLGDVELFDVTYDPHMIETAIDDMIAYLENGTKNTNHVIPVTVVDSSNVATTEGFGGKVS